MFALLLLPFKVQSQNRDKELWILYDKNDSLSNKISKREWDFYTSNTTLDHGEIFCFSIKKIYQNADTLYKLPCNIVLYKGKKLFKKAHADFKHRKDIPPFDLDWLNKLYDNIFIVEKENDYYLIYHVKFHACEI